LLLLFGASGAGKTFALDPLRELLPALAIHDFDEIGVPAGADTGWRQRSNEAWIRRALDDQAHGVDFVLAGQTPFGELLASPSAPLLEAISGCLIDCDDETRHARLRARGPGHHLNYRMASQDGCDEQRLAAPKEQRLRWCAAQPVIRRMVNRPALSTGTKSGPGSTPRTWSQSSRASRPSLVAEAIRSRSPLPRTRSEPSSGS
jgi:hypothetical protein